MAHDKNDYYKFFNDLINEPSPDKYVIISKADNNGNYAMFSCIKENNRYLCGGHIGLYNSNTNYSPITFADLFKLLEYLQNHNIGIRFRDQFYQFKEMTEEKNNVTDYNLEEEYQNIDESVLALSLDDIRQKIIYEKGFCNLSYDVIKRLSYNTDENFREKIRTIGDLVRLSPEELAVSVGYCGERGYNEIVDFLEMFSIDTHRYRTYHYSVDISSFHILFDCNFSIRTFNALYYNGKIKTVGDLVRLSPEELMKIKGIGKKGYGEVVDNLKALGLDTRKYTK